MVPAPQEPLDVAIKVLKENHARIEQESHQLKLLTEAAVMGQFKHQNIVRLYGMVTVTQPVSYFYVHSGISDGGLSKKGHTIII